MLIHIPVKPHIAQYLHSRYGQPVQLRAYTLLAGVCFPGLTQQPEKALTDQPANLAPLALRIQSQAAAVYVSAEGHQALGLRLDEFFMTHAKDWVLRDMQATRSIKVSAGKFLKNHGITEDDYKLESFYRALNRYGIYKDHIIKQNTISRALTDTQVLEVVMGLQQGVSYRQLADRYGVGLGTITRIVKKFLPTLSASGTPLPKAS